MKRAERILCEVVVYLVMISGATGGVPAQAFAFEKAKPSAEVDSSWVARFERELLAQEYHASPSARGLQAPNRAHGFRMRFDEFGVHVEDREEADRALVGLRLDRFGRGEAAESVAPGPIACRAQGRSDSTASSSCALRRSSISRSARATNRSWSRQPVISTMK